MQNKKIGLFCAVLFGGLCCSSVTYAVDNVVEELDVVVEEVTADQESANAIADYDVTGSLFQQITTLEQEKILMQLEKERAQLDLELDRLAAEKIKLHMEIDTLSGRAEQQQQEIETQKAKLEAEAARIEREKESWLADFEDKKNSMASASVSVEQEPVDVDITRMYRLVNVVGAGSQLQATVEDLVSGQSKRIGVGKTLEGLQVKSISLDEGVVFVDDNGRTQTLNVSNGK